MKSARFVQSLVRFVPRASALAGSLGLAALLSLGALAQDTTPPATKAAPKGLDQYIIHQSFDLGGHIAPVNGSQQMYNTLVNYASGPRILNHTLEIHAKDGVKNPFVDTLYASSSGYGGDPYSFSTLRASKGKILDFAGSFRRDRQYFDYNLWGNPLVPGGSAAPVSNGYTFGQVLQSPHYFNTVRRNTDLALTFFPLAKFTLRTEYNLNVMEGPSQSSIHQGADALLRQNFRNSTQTFLAGFDWKPLQQTTLTYEQVVTNYKGNTYWTLTGLNMQLPNGQPVTIGFDIVANPAPTSAASGCGAHPAVLDSTTNPPTANPCVNGYTSYSRFSPMRTLLPSEQFRFQSSTIKNVQMTGRFTYTGGTMKMPQYQEIFTGLESRVTSPAPPGATSWCTTTAGKHNDCHSLSYITGDAKGQRINVSGDFGIVWQASKEFAFSDQVDVQNWRQPAVATFTEIDGYAASMTSPLAFTTAPDVTEPINALGQKMVSNTLLGEWEASSWVQLSLGYRYRARTLEVQRTEPTEAVTTPAGLTYNMDIHQQSGLFDITVRPSQKFRANSSVEIGWADAAYVQTNPRQFQKYQLHAQFKPKEWATISGSFRDEENRDGAYLVNYKAHNRAFSATTSVAPSEQYSFELTYGYLDVFSTVVDCFADTVPPASGVTPMPIGTPCGNAVNTATSRTAFYGNSFFQAPTQYGSAGLVFTPNKDVTAGFGYRINSVDGSTQLLHPLAVPGTLQSNYQTPYANVAWNFSHSWAMKGDWTHYRYVEGGPAGPTSSRNFISSVYTLGMHYQY